MKRKLHPLFIWLLIFNSLSGFAQLQQGADRHGHGGSCDPETNCFSTEIIRAEKKGDHCTEYEFKISANGNCAHALSHYTVAIPCGKVYSLWNSEKWKQVFGYDPTTKLTGFKIDDISNFGEKPGSFTVKFLLCSNDSICDNKLKCWNPLVAYKASTDVFYDTIPGICPSSLRASIVKKEISCNGATDGSLAVNVEDGIPPYTYIWSNGATTDSISNLATGNYSVTVTDASGATATLSSTITQPEAIVISGTITAASCSGISNGAIDVSVTGGQGTFNYSWNNGATTQDLSGLSSGIYILTVKDGAGCSVQKSFSVTNSSQLLISVTPVLPTCGQANGSINITVTGGNPPYTYTWSNGATTEDLQNLAAGLYKVTVKDSSGCSTELAYNLRENNTLKLNATVTQTSCTDDASGAVDLIVTGGTPPYTYTWSNGVTTEDLSGLTAGLYKVTVTDSNGCTATLQVNVSKKTFQSGAQITQLRCDGEASGSIILNPTGGIAPYTYQWSNESTGNSLTGLPSGAYTVVVTDAEGCTVTFTFVISNPVAITASATVTNSQCNTEGNYSIDLTVNGGKSPYTYTWSNGATTEDLSNVSTGTYTVVIKDANGCSLTKQVAVSGSTSGWACLINQPDSIPTCGSIGNVLSTSVAGATSYQWSVTSTDNQWSITGGSTTASILYIAGGENSSATFTLTIVKDGCTQTCNYTASSCTTGSSGGGNGGEDCDECFDSSITLLSSEGSCKTYKALISTTGECRHELSHWTIAIPCGSLQSYSNSEGWAMEIGKDPTTGLYGLKIDNINGFGNEQATFTVTFTLCSNDYNCSNTLKNWQPVVAYKAGLCVAYDTLNQGDGDGPVVCAYPNPFYGSVHFNWRCDEDDYIELDILDKCGKEVHKVFKGNVEKGQTYSFECTGDNLHDDLYIYRFASTRKKIVYGKLVKKD